MNISKLIINTCLCASLAFGAHAAVGKAGAINLKMNSFKEVVKTDKTGKKKIVLEKVESAVPGDKITYITEYKNVSADTIDAGAIISNIVPKNTHYIDNSAYCDSCSIVFSVDGTRYDKLQNLKVSLGKGKLRAATHKDVKKVRWQLSSDLAPKTQGVVGFKVQINQDTIAR